METKCIVCTGLIGSKFTSVCYDSCIYFFCEDPNCLEQWENAKCKTCLDEQEIYGNPWSDDGMGPCFDCAFDNYD